MPTASRIKSQNGSILPGAAKWHEICSLPMRPWRRPHGSLGVGRFYFRVRVDSGQIFDLYYDREIQDVDDRLGHWFLYRELGEISTGNTRG